MVRNNQNRIKKQALKRKAIIKKETERYGINIDNDPISIGIIVDSFLASQNSFFLADQLGSFLENSLNIDIQVFVEHACPPCSNIRFPIFDTHALTTYNNPIIVSNINACLTALNSPSQHICHYIFDIDFLDGLDLNMNTLCRAFRDSRVELFTRCEDYKVLIEAEFNVKVNDPIIPDWNLKPLFKTLISLIRSK